MRFVHVVYLEVKACLCSNLVFLCILHFKFHLLSLYFIANTITHEAAIALLPSMRTNQNCTITHALVNLQSLAKDVQLEGQTDGKLCSSVEGGTNGKDLTVCTCKVIK